MKILWFIFIIGLFCNPLAVAIQLYQFGSGWILYGNIIGCVILGYALKAGVDY